MQELFLREHNQVADLIAKEHPEFTDDDQALFDKARLVVSAVAAKIHTVDWTVELLKTKILEFSMQTNWYGVGKPLGIPSWLSKSGPPGILGLVGMDKPDTHGVPFCLTEEFVAVYRLHPLLPDGLPVKGLGGRLDFIELEKLVGPYGDEVLRKSHDGAERFWESCAKYPCGNLVLFNYPKALRSLTPTDDCGRPLPDLVDLAALDLYRDRERGILPFNEFRRQLHLGSYRDWADLTGGNEEYIEALSEVYGEDGIEQCDLLVGNLAEKKISGFAISETSFFIFVVMASRRLEADPYLTEYFNERTYTKIGYEWVRSTSSLLDVLQRHYPRIAAQIPKGYSAFKPRETWPEQFT